MICRGLEKKYLAWFIITRMMVQVHDPLFEIVGNWIAVISRRLINMNEDVNRCIQEPHGQRLPALMVWPPIEGFRNSFLPCRQ